LKLKIDILLLADIGPHVSVSSANNKNEKSPIQSNSLTKNRQVCLKFIWIYIWNLN